MLPNKALEDFGYQLSTPISINPFYLDVIFRPASSNNSLVLKIQQAP